MAHTPVTSDFTNSMTLASALGGTKQRVANSTSSVGSTTPSRTTLSAHACASAPTSRRAAPPVLPITWLCARRRHAATQGKLLEVSHLTRGGHGQQAPGRIGVAKRLASHGEVGGRRMPTLPALARLGGWAGRWVGKWVGRILVGGHVVRNANRYSRARPRREGGVVTAGGHAARMRAGWGAAR